MIAKEGGGHLCIREATFQCDSLKTKKIVLSSHSSMSVRHQSLRYTFIRGMVLSQPFNAKINESINRQSDHLGIRYCGISNLPSPSITCQIVLHSLILDISLLCPVFPVVGYFVFYTDLPKKKSSFIRTVLNLIEIITTVQMMSLGRHFQLKTKAFKKVFK